MKIPQNKLEEMAWWENDARADHVKSATSCSGKNPFIKLPILPSKKDVENKIVLDIGCGYGRTLIPLAKFKPKIAYGLDISKEMLGHCAKYAKENKVKLILINASLPKLPFKDKSIDLIFSSSVLLHLPKEDIGLLFGEVKRVLKPHGKAIFESSFPNSLNLNGASNWFPSLVKSKLLNKPIIPGMPKHYTYWELKSFLNKSGLNYKITFSGYQIIPTSFNKITLPAKKLIEKFNLLIEPKISNKGYFLLDFFLPRYFDITLCL